MSSQSILSLKSVSGLIKKLPELFRKCRFAIFRDRVKVGLSLFSALFVFGLVPGLLGAAPFVVCPQNAAARHVMCGVSPTAKPSVTPTPKPTQKPIIKADPNNPPTAQGYNLHTFVQWDVNFLDSYVQVNDSGLSTDPSDPESFLTNEMWRNDGTTAYWQEIGYVAGQLQVQGQNQYYTGIFGAFDTSNGYDEFPITSNPQPYQQGFYGAWVALAVETKTPNWVDLNYNNSTYGSVLTSSTSSSNAQIGMESNSSYDQFNSFSGNIDLVGPQVFQGGSSWNYWPSDPGSLIFYNDSPGDSAICGWISSDPTYTPNEPYASCEYDG